jgi:hypothetical protein
MIQVGAGVVLVQSVVMQHAPYLGGLAVLAFTQTLLALRFNEQGVGAVAHPL